MQAKTTLVVPTTTAHLFANSIDWHGGKDQGMGGLERSRSGDAGMQERTQGAARGCSLLHRMATSNDE